VPHQRGCLNDAESRLRFRRCADNARLVAREASLARRVSIIGLLIFDSFVSGLDPVSQSSLCIRRAHWLYRDCKRWRGAN